MWNPFNFAVDVFDGKLSDFCVVQGLERCVWVLEVLLRLFSDTPLQGNAADPWQNEKVRFTVLTSLGSTGTLFADHFNDNLKKVKKTISTARKATAKQTAKAVKQTAKQAAKQTAKQNAKAAPRAHTPASYALRSTTLHFRGGASNRV
jgi:hypothetical protein